MKVILHWRVLNTFACLYNEPPCINVCNQAGSKQGHMGGGVLKRSEIA